VAARLAFAGVALLYGVRLAFKGGTASAVPGARRPTPSSIGALVSGLAVAPPPLAGCLAVVPCPGSSPAVVPGSSRPPVDVPDAFRPTLVALPCQGAWPGHPFSDCAPTKAALWPAGSPDLRCGSSRRQRSSGSVGSGEGIGCG
jgi:hypothetical protein